jgi:hypothetical protein
MYIMNPEVIEVENSVNPNKLKDVKKTSGKALW